MPTSQRNFQNGTEQFNIFLDSAGRLTFNANALDGDGDTRMEIEDDTGRVTIGGHGQKGLLDIHDDTSTTTFFVDGESGNVTVGRAGAASGARLFGDGRGLELDNSQNERTAFLSAQAVNDGGELFLADADGDVTIQCFGHDGEITCQTLTTGGGLRADVEPLAGALDSVSGLRAVRYRRGSRTGPASADGDAWRIGFVNEEAATACPDMVVTDGEGRPSVDYLRVTAVLVEAVKEQQRALREQSAALDEASRRISALEA